MLHVITARFEDGVLKPDQSLNLPPHARVHVTVELLREDEETGRQHAWQELEILWQQSRVDSHGERLRREQLHERR